jgi:hypothetical protein
MVEHCGGSKVGGNFFHTLTLTDIHSGWTECAALVVREQSLVVAGISAITQHLPFALRGLDTDNDSAFMNETLQGYCDQYRIEWTRSCAYHQNDQAWVEQKNGAVVRRLAGYGRLSGLAAAGALQRLYASARLYVYFFEPSLVENAHRSVRRELAAGGKLAGGGTQHHRQRTYGAANHPVFRSLSHRRPTPELATTREGLACAVGAPTRTRSRLCRSS